MHKIMATVTNALMDARQNLVGFAPLFGTLFRFGLLASSLCQCFFITTKEARVVYELTIGQGHERIKASIKANSVRAGR